KAVALDGQPRGALIDNARHAHHTGDAWSVNVGIHQPDPVSVHVDSQGQVGSRGRFSDASFAASDGKDGLHAWQRDLLLASSGGLHFAFSYQETALGTFHQ